MAESLAPLWTMVSTRDSDDTESHGSIITRVTLKITHFLTRRQIHHLGKRHLAVMFSLFQRPLAQSPIDHFLSGDWSVEAKYIHTPTTPPPPPLYLQLLLSVAASFHTESTLPASRSVNALPHRNWESETHDAHALSYIHSISQSRISVSFSGHFCETLSLALTHTPALLWWVIARQ